MTINILPLQSGLYGCVAAPLALYEYNNLLKRGVRIALRSKVNDILVTGIKTVDALIPVGRGQRQLILGDRYTGKTSLFLYIIINSGISN